MNALNSNELLIKVNHVLDETGLLNDITEFFHEHPEYFTECTDGKTIISGLTIDIAMCCRPQDRLNSSVFILSHLGTCDKVCVELNDHSRSAHTKPELKRSINGKEVSRYVLD